MNRMTVLNNLYNEFAAYYATITNDRDFKTQMQCILDTYDAGSPCNDLLELFAGQSFHSIEAMKQGAEIWAIDSSADMKELAIANGFNKAGQYVVGNLPEAVSAMAEAPRFDCVLCLFNGICNLNTEGLSRLFKALKEVVSEKGKVFLELQDLFYMMEYVSDPSVHYHDVAHGDYAMIKYAWPAEKIKWNPYSFTAEVPVKMMIQSWQGTQLKDFTSTDHIHSTEVVLFLAGLAGFKGKILSEEEPWKTAFQFSVVLELSLA